MADHAKKGRPKKPAAKRNTRGAKSQPSGPKPRVWLMLFLVVLIAGSFGYFLFFINGSADEQPVVIEKVKPKNKTVAKNAPLPQAPKESWVYESLDKKEITVDLPADDIVTTKRRYRLQCASFKLLTQAEAMKAKMAFMGEEPNIKKVQGSKGIWYQVILGPYDNKRQAESTRHKMQRANINTCEIFYWT